jgi:hypothetical protein
VLICSNRAIKETGNQHENSMKTEENGGLLAQDLSGAPSKQLSFADLSNGGLPDRPPHIQVRQKDP